eukprot:TRINITY_DN11855_c0_g1_i1.p1 TRINITY_DN11855_c0_g1~~TRINITY_DN11855_c0_g1_i1.p1  ORF type:complete len:377 (+),score=20.36 TRINITY_DN11855_c0_g1_i1:151-1131(+)
MIFAQFDIQLENQKNFQLIHNLQMLQNQDIYDATIVDTILRQIITRQENFEIRNYLRVLDFLKNMRHFNKNFLSTLSQIIKQLNEEQTQQLSVIDLNRICTNMAFFLFKDQDLLKFLRSIFLQKVRNITSPGKGTIVPFMSGQAVLQEWEDRDWWTSICTLLNTHIVGDGLDQHQLSHIRLMGYADKQPDYIGRAIPQIKKLGTQRWIRNLQIQVSVLQLDIFETLISRGIGDVKFEHSCAGGLFLVDVLIRKGERLVAVEVDGDLHYMANEPQMLTGKSVVRNRILKAFGFEVVCIKSTDWYMLKSQQEKNIFLEELLQKHDLLD